MIDRRGYEVLDYKVQLAFPAIIVSQLIGGPAIYAL
jgi:hypothetical protein